MPNYDRALAIKDLGGYDLASQLSAANFLLGVASNRDIVDILTNYLFESYDHDQNAARTRKKTGQRYFREVADRIMSTLLGPSSPLGPDEKKHIAEEIISDHGDPKLRMWSCRFMSHQDPSPISMEQVESMLAKDEKVLPECDAVDLARFIWESDEVQEQDSKAFALVNLVLGARPDMVEHVKYCLSIPTYIPKLKNPHLATWALEKMIGDHPSRDDAYAVRHMPLAMKLNPSLLQGVLDVPPSMLKTLSESSTKLKPEDHQQYAIQMMALLQDRAGRATTGTSAIATIEALPVPEATAFVAALEARKEFPQWELKRVLLYRMMADPSTALKAIDEVASDPKNYQQEAAKLILEDKYMAHRELAIKKLIPALANVSDKEYMVKIIDSLPGKLRTMALVLAASTWKVWSPGEMAQMLETESEEVSQSLKELMSEHGLGSLIPYDLERRRNRVLVPPGMPVAFEREL